MLDEHHLKIFFTTGCADQTALLLLDRRNNMMALSAVWRDSRGHEVAHRDGRV